MLSVLTLMFACQGTYMTLIVGRHELIICGIRTSVRVAADFGFSSKSIAVHCDLYSSNSAPSHYGTYLAACLPSDVPLGHPQVHSTLV